MVTTSTCYECSNTQLALSYTHNSHDKLNSGSSVQLLSLQFFQLLKAIKRTKFLIEYFKNNRSKFFKLLLKLKCGLFKCILPDSSLSIAYRLT